MTTTLFHNRPAVAIANDLIRVTILVRGGHIAEIQELSTGVNPLWIPPWLDEPNPDFGNNCETRLLEGIMGHNLCLDLFGPPSEAEEKAGVVAHGEGGIEPYTFEETPEGLISRCLLAQSQLTFERTITLEGRLIRFRETVENLSTLDKPIGWTQHITFGPPFMEHGATLFRWPYTHSSVMNEAYTAYLMDEPAWFAAWSPVEKTAIAYRWSRADFPWMGIWKENRGRTHTPWNGRTVTQGMEFGVSPFPETRRAMIERGKMFDTPCYRWIGAKEKLTAEYQAVIAPADALPESFSSLSK
jgi:hypothetical protein